jgi:N-acetylneuraminate lyase
MKQIHGIMPASITPFNDDHSVNYAMIEPLVNHFIKAGVGGLFINGSSAEFLTLSDDERKQLAETFIAAIAGRIPTIVYVGSRELSSVVDLAKHAESIGADAIATQPPLDRANSTVDADFEWYRAVGASSSLPLYVYLRSDMGSSEMRPDDFLARMATIPTFAGIKYGASNFHILQTISRQASMPVNVLTGPDELLLAGLVMGSDGGVGTTYNAFPNLSTAIYRSWEAGDIRAAEKLQAQLGELIEALIDMGIVLAGTKAIMREQGLAVGQCRPSVIYGMAQSAHTEKAFTDSVTDEQLSRLMAIVNTYNMN